MICNSCRPTRIQHGQKSFWSFLQWRRLILGSYTRIFHQVFFLGLILFPECIAPSGFLRLMYILLILFCTIPGIDVVNLDRLFMQDRVKWYSEIHWMCLIQIELDLLKIKFQWWWNGRRCHQHVHMIQLSKLLQ